MTLPNYKFKPEVKRISTSYKCYSRFDLNMKGIVHLIHYTICILYFDLYVYPFSVLKSAYAFVHAYVYA